MNIKLTDYIIYLMLFLFQIIGYANANKYIRFSIKYSISKTCLYS